MATKKHYIDQLEEISKEINESTHQEVNARWKILFKFLILISFLLLEFKLSDDI
jgi:hypothetical protein